MTFGKRCLSALAVLALCCASSPAAGATGLRGLSAGHAADRPELFVSDRLDGMALVGTALYWKSDCGGDFAPARSHLERMATDSVIRAGLYNPPTCEPDRIASTSIAVDDHFVYWLTGNGSVARLPNNAGTGTAPTILITHATAHAISGFPSCCAIAVDDSYLYWNDGHIVYRMAKHGEPPQEIFSATGAVTDLRAGGSGALFVRSGSTLSQLRPNAGRYTAWNVAGNASAFVLDGARVYWAAVVGRSYAIHSARADDLSDSRILYLGSGVRSPGVDNLAVDAANLYWHATINSAGGPIYRMSRTGGAPTAISDYLLMGVPMLSDGAYLFWTDYNTGIYRLSTGASAAGPPGNVFITGIEATQSIQTTDNRIPLINNKRTLIRVYVQSHDDGNGPWSGVTARLTVAGNPHVHVPILHYTITVLPTGSDRTSLDNSFTFELDPIDTIPGHRTITVQLVLPSGRAFTATPDSTRTMTLSFGPSTPSMSFGIYGVRYSYRNPTTAALPFSDIVQEAGFTSALFPTSMIYVLRLPGDPTASFDFNMGSGYLDGRAWGASLIDHAFPGGGQRIDILQPEFQDNHYNGADFTSGPGNFVINEQYLTIDPGPVLAHELGHSWLGSNHVISPEHAAYPPPFDDFPYAHASIGPQVGVEAIPGPSGTSVTLASGIPPDPHWHDIMSYGHPAWASPYSYCKLIHVISAGSLECPSGANVAQNISVPSTGRLAASVPPIHAASAAAPLSANRPIKASVPAAATRHAEQITPAIAQATRQAALLPYIYVLGRFTADGNAVFYPFDVEKSTQNLASKLAGKKYTLQLLDRRGKVLRSFNFGPPSGSGHPVYRGPDVFSMYLPYDPATASIVMRFGAKVMARRTVSAHTPEVRLIAPLNGTLRGRQTIRWAATDADHDHLTYIVEYSSNGGIGWTPLGVNLTGTSLQVDTATLPGSNNALIRVLASDGVNTGEARSQSLRVPFAPPQVTLQSPSTGAVFQQNQPVDAQGFAVSPQDGPITGIKHYRWSSDRDGALGIGQWISRTLTPGRHRLTLTVTDGAGRRASASVQVVVLGAKPPVHGKPTATATATATATFAPKPTDTFTQTPTPTPPAKVTATSTATTQAATSTASATASPTATSTVAAQSACTVGGQHLENFDTGYSGAWHLFLPSKSISVGPTGTGCLRISIPADAVYDSWSTVDNAPELTRSDVGKGGWTATTRMTVSSTGASGGGYHTGLLVRFFPQQGNNPPDQIFWGIQQVNPAGPVLLTLDRTGINNIAVVPSSTNTILLRTVFKTDGQKLCQYSFAYQMQGQADFTFVPQTIDTCQALAGIGIFSKTFNGAPRAVSSDFDWFDLTNP